MTHDVSNDNEEEGDSQTVVNIDTGEVKNIEDVDPSEVASGEIADTFKELQDLMSEMSSMKDELAEEGIEMPQELSRYDRRVLKKKLKAAEKQKKMKEYKLNRLAKEGKIDLATHIPDELKDAVSQSGKKHILEWDGRARISYGSEDKE